MPTKKFIVHGLVQGVGFRFYTLREAQRLGLTGRVQNLPDGAVQVIAQGSESQLADLFTWLHRGSPAAAVDYVEAETYYTEQQFSDFKITM